MAVWVVSVGLHPELGTCAVNDIHYLMPSGGTSLQLQRLIKWPHNFTSLEELPVKPCTVPFLLLTKKLIIYLQQSVPYVIFLKAPIMNFPC